ncbi:MAG: HU family DNA-binding protein [Mucinivorans sp.]
MNSKHFFTMNKSQLVDAIAAESKLTKIDAKKALEAFVSVTSKALKEGDKIALVGFGSFAVSEKPARSGRNPRTGETIQIAAKKTVKFKSGTELTDTVQ